MHVTAHLEQPTRKHARAARCGLRRLLPYLALLPAGFALPSPLPSTRCALTAPFQPCRHAFARLGGFFSVALSVGSRPPGVTWRRTLWSPDFPPRPCGRSDCLADSRAHLSASASRASSRIRRRLPGERECTRVGIGAPYAGEARGAAAAAGAVAGDEAGRRASRRVRRLPAPPPAHPRRGSRTRRARRPDPTLRAPGELAERSRDRRSRSAWSARARRRRAARRRRPPRGRRGTRRCGAGPRRARACASPRRARRAGACAQRRARAGSPRSRSGRRAGPRPRARRSAAFGPGTGVTTMPAATAAATSR